MPRYIIGRSETSDIILKDPSVSKVHAELFIDANSFSIRDLGSSNGTFVNGQKINGAYSLGQFDILKVGNSLVPWKNYMSGAASSNRTMIVNNANLPTGMPSTFMPQPIPNGTTTLVLGICSIVFSCVLIGLVLGIISLSTGSKGRKLYKQNPASFTGYGALNAGYICGLIGTILGSLYIFYYIIWVLILGAAAASAFSILNNI